MRANAHGVVLSSPLLSILDLPLYYSHIIWHSGIIHGLGCKYIIGRVGASPPSHVYCRYHKIAQETRPRMFQKHMIYGQWDNII